MDRKIVRELGEVREHKNGDCYQDVLLECGHLSAAREDARRERKTWCNMCYQLREHGIIVAGESALAGYEPLCGPGLYQVHRVDLLEQNVQIVSETGQRESCPDKWVWATSGQDDWYIHARAATMDEARAALDALLEARREYLAGREALKTLKTEIELLLCPSPSPQIVSRCSRADADGDDPFCEDTNCPVHGTVAHAA